MPVSARRVGVHGMSAVLFGASIFMFWGTLASGPLEIRFAEPGMQICVTAGAMVCRELDWIHVDSAHLAFESILYGMATGDAAQRYAATQAMRSAAGKWDAPAAFPHIEYIFPVIAVATLISGIVGGALVPAIVMAGVTIYMFVIITPASTTIDYGAWSALAASIISLTAALLEIVPTPRKHGSSSRSPV